MHLVQLHDGPARRGGRHLAKICRHNNCRHADTQAHQQAAQHQAPASIKRRVLDPKGDTSEYIRQRDLTSCRNVASASRWVAYGAETPVVPAAVAMTMGPSMKSTLSMVMAMRRP